MWPSRHLKASPAAEVAIDGELELGRDAVLMRTHLVILIISKNFTCMKGEWLCAKRTSDMVLISGL